MGRRHVPPVAAAGDPPAAGGSPPAPAQARGALPPASAGPFTRGPTAPAGRPTRGPAARRADDTVHLSFSGGEARGYAHIGCLQAVERLGLRVTGVSGSSIGALVAALVAAGSTAADLERLGATLRRRQFLRYGWPEVRTLLNLLRRAGRRQAPGVWSLAAYHRTVDRLLGGVRFRHLRLPCVIQATDLTRGRRVQFSTARDPDMAVAFAVAASSAYPGLMAPVDWGGRDLVDGGAFVDLRAARVRAGRIVVSNVSLQGYAPGRPATPLGLVAAYLRYLEGPTRPPPAVRGVPVTVITYPASLGRVRAFRKPRPAVARQIIRDAREAALRALRPEGPR